jgi:hypothetical protein
MNLVSISVGLKQPLREAGQFFVSVIDIRN